MDESAKPAFSASPVSRSSSVSATSRQLRALQRSAQSIDRTAVAQATKRARKAAAANAAQAVRFVPLIKFAVFVFIVWNVAGWMLTIPEVFALKERLKAGQFSEGDVLAARDAIGARIQTFLRNAQDPNPPPSGSQPPAEAPPEPTRPVPVSVSEQAIASVSAPPAVADVPPGVSVPGDGVTLPRVLRMVPPTYTAEARRAKIEGVVGTDGGRADTWRCRQHLRRALAG